MADGDAPDLSLIPEPLWQEAERRAAVLRPLADLPACSRDQARMAATALGVTERQVYRLLRKCREGGGTLTAMLRGRSSGGRGKARIAERRDTLIREAVSDLYLTPQRLSAASIVVEVRKRARAQHVRPPSAGTVRRRIAALSMEDRRQRGDVDVPEAVLGSTVTAQAPLDMVQIDHTPVDLILVDPIERRPIGRPWVTVAIDVFSRCIAGFHVTLEAPSSTSVGLCLAHVASDKRDWLEAIEIDADWPVMGRPRRIGVDNATEFHSEALERGCAQHDITIDWRPLGRPQVGGVVERVIGTLMELVHALPGTTFSNVMQRGRYDSDRAACLTLAELERWLAVAIAKLYHLRPHAGLDGEVPLRRYQEGVRALATEGRAPPTPRDPRAFLIDFLPVVRRTLRRDGVVIDDHARRRSSNTAIASFALDAEPGAWDQPEDGGEMVEAGDERGFEDRAEGPSLHDLDPSRGGSGRRIPASHITAARRLPLCVAAVDPASDTVSAAPLPAASWHIPSSGHRGGQAEATALQALPDRLLPDGYRRGSDCRRQGSPELVEGLYLFVGIDRTSKFAVTQLVDKVARRTAWEFLELLLKAVPYRIHTTLTDNSIQFAEQPRIRNTAWSRQMRFDMICEANDIEHRLTKPNHPWTNGHVERMNRTIKEATVKRFHYENHEQLRVHLADS
ncbi:hypothetical protein HMP09_2714 [Sphingomonas sp. HMP9]|nr:hypothetical protein HMP09_2714 [Sphingomonas sp. HMP9]